MTHNNDVEPMNVHWPKTQSDARPVLQALLERFAALHPDCGTDNDPTGFLAGDRPIPSSCTQPHLHAAPDNVIAIHPDAETYDIGWVTWKFGPRLVTALANENPVGAGAIHTLVESNSDLGAYLGWEDMTSTELAERIAGYERASDSTQHAPSTGEWS